MFTQGLRVDWLQTIAAQIMDGGAMPPSIDRLNITVPPQIMTRVSDGHCTAAAAFGEERRKDMQAGWQVIISEMVTLLREQGFVGGSDQGLTWIKPLDGTWKVNVEGRQYTVSGQSERRADRDRAVVGVRDETTGERIGTPSLFERGRMAPLELLVESSRGNIKSQKFEIHPLANLMPSYTEVERETLRKDIERVGVRVPIVIYQKKILDGRNRGYFATQFNKPVRVTEFTGTEEEARRLVISLNVVRRHLTSAQQQLLTNEIFGEEARKEAEIIHKRRVGRPKKAAENSVPKSDTNSEQDNVVYRWEDIAARKGNAAGFAQATAKGVRLMEDVKDEPQTRAEVENQTIKTAANAAKKARERKGKPKAETFEGSHPRTHTKHLGEMIYHANACIKDFEMPVGTMPEMISERVHELRRLLDDLERVYRERKWIS